ncbi:hypothetical protein I317_00074 [Kwoniella heveanensis CBS 569]|uniref:DUF423-domain-containing protein n=1 Tax=Kwoniella heveanensis BCC8398 TaxID=1296120 RepID=A0A1B9H1Q3_9TREE|nr:hypothetical protein I316_01109 [Kwoniella heveanensis BCC8398]OCF45986.1 hypothetical protein I317_00074 [Kwoniella heveanensis CBS 569]
MNPSFVFRSGALLTATGISFGAFGSHGLRNIKPPLPETKISSFNTAASYLIYNGIALLAISFHPALLSATSKRFRLGAGLIMGGALVFSGSIFGLVLARDRFRWLGPVTPLGGMGMIAG